MKLTKLCLYTTAYYGRIVAIFVERRRFSPSPSVVFAQSLIFNRSPWYDRECVGGEVIPGHTFAPAQKPLSVPFSPSRYFIILYFMTAIHLCIGALVCGIESIGYGR